MKIYDVTIPLSSSTPVWEGEEGIHIHQSAVIGLESDYNVSRCEFGVHSGTHVDAPFHVLKSGKTVDSIPLQKLVGIAQVVEIPEDIGLITRKVLQDVTIDRDIKKIMFKTRNSAYWNEDPLRFSRDYVGLDTSGAEYLVSIKMELVGIDYFSVSAYDDLLQPHKTFLSDEVVLLENLDLRKINPGVYTILCLPLKIVGTDGAPARVVLTRDQ